MAPRPILMTRGGEAYHYVKGYTKRDGTKVSGYWKYGDIRYHPSLHPNSISTKYSRKNRNSYVRYHPSIDESFTPIPRAELLEIAHGRRRKGYQPFTPIPRAELLEIAHGRRRKGPRLLRTPVASVQETLRPPVEMANVSMVVNQSDSSQVLTPVTAPPVDLPQPPSVVHYLPPSVSDIPYDGKIKAIRKKGGFHPYSKSKQSRAAAQILPLPINNVPIEMEVVRRNKTTAARAIRHKLTDEDRRKAVAARRLNAAIRRESEDQAKRAYGQLVKRVRVRM